MKVRRGLLCVLAALAAPAAVRATEPNQTFATSTLLPAGTFLISDTLTPGILQQPDTFLGARNAGGMITVTDDDGSIFGGTASGLTNVPTNSQSLRFSVTGKGDVNFNGSHSQVGAYTVFVEVFNASGGAVGSFTQSRTLVAGGVNNFLFNGNSSWVNGRYSVQIDNSISSPTGGDVDFFTFQGLTPGTAFDAQTLEPNGINTFLNQYNSSGVLIATKDGFGGERPRITGAVPADGKLTFAVTGFGDDMTNGSHAENGAYQLKIMLPDLPEADFDHNGVVNAADLAVWKTANANGTAAADADFDFDSDGVDFLIWQRQLGQTAGASAAVHAAPEPASAALLASALAASTAALRRRSF